MTAVGEPVVRRLVGPRADHEEAWVADAAYVCDGCHHLSVVTWMTSHDLTNTWLADYGHDGGPQPYEHATWFPIPGHNKEFPDVPEHIAVAATEAWTCHTAGATRGACALARAVVEATAKAKGVTAGRLVEKIDKLATSGLIRPAVQEQAHEIRHIGNDVAHGDLDDKITVEDSAEVLELMGELLNEVFQAPARKDRLKAAREARRATPQA